MIRWGNLTFTELEKKINDKTVVILPIGSVEEHGPHLPLSSDMIQPNYVAEQVSEKMGAIILPPISYGWTETMNAFKGTVSITFDTLKALVFDILDSVCKTGVKNIVILSGHASRLHMAALNLAADEILDIHHAKIMVLSDYDIAYEYRGKLVPESDSHAGIIETSRVMAIAPELVKKERKFEKKKEEKKFLILKDIREYYPYGTLSDPTGANAELGAELNKLIVDRLIEYIKSHFEL